MVSCLLLNNNDCAPKDSMKETKFRLSDLSANKRYFNPNSAADLKEYKYFLENKRWNKLCPFIIEWPHLTITGMVQEKLLQAHIDNLIQITSTRG